MTYVVSPSATPIEERARVDGKTFATEIARRYRPIVLRGQMDDWPAVAAARRGHRALVDYVSGFGGGAALEVLVGPPEIDGRFFYNASLSGFNFQRQQVPLPALMWELLRLAEQDVAAPSALYAGSAPAPDHLPGWNEANPLDLPTPGAVPRVWIGNATQVATHYDVSTNLAVVVAGTRRFTLFPPEQLPNLYVGPLDVTPAGPPVSMVDPEAPDLERYPRFAEALAHAQTAELGPGDALFIPAIWWHHVRAFDRINVLVNYWWASSHAASPFFALLHAMMSVRDLPFAEKQAWRAWFDHLVFDKDADRVGDHLPPAVRSVLGPASAERTDRIHRHLATALQGK